MEEKLLTIIIPTYNRCEILRENLNYTLALVSEFQEYVCVYVSDNASSDKTEEVCSFFLKDYPDLLTYHKQDYNLGALANFKHAVENVNSEYVCLLGDDDMISPYYIKTILDIIKKYSNVGLIHYNYLMGSLQFDNSELMYKSLSFGSGDYCTLYKDGKNFIYNTLNGFSLMSSNVFKRELWLKAREKELDCPGYSWFSILCNAIISEPCVFYSYPILYQRFSGIGGYSKRWPLYYVYGLGMLFHNLSSEIDGLYEHWILHSQCYKNAQLIDWIIDTNRHKSFYKEHKNDMLKYLENKKDRILFKLSIYMPTWLYARIIPKCLKYIRLIKNYK